jgi:predicted lipoprotein with Yx(FWY)xxD motif
VLVDQNGCALYLNVNDTATSTACDATCEITWIPLTAPAQVRGSGLDQGKVGTFQRPSGKTQVTYNGHQLYRFAGDRAPGEAKGQGVNDTWWLVGANGDPVK